MAKVKVSGLTNYNDALNATNLGADFLSFSFIKESPKKVSEKLFLDITSKLPPFINCVAVFGRNKQKDILRIIKKYSIKNVQFNEEISSEICKSIKETQNIKIFKYFKINQESDILALASYKDIADYFVLSVDCINGQSSKDSYDIVLKAIDLKVPIFVDVDVMTQLDEIKNFVKNVNPYGFDSDSLIERLAKRKDYDKMSVFVKTSHGF